MIIFKAKYLLIAFIPLALAGCVSTEEQHSMDQGKCASYGYEPGTNRFADCMKDRDWQRQDDQRRTMEDLEKQDRRNQRQFEQNWRDNQERQDRLYRQQNNSIDTRPQYDKDGNPNFDTDGNYQGCNGIGCKVDNPDD